MGRGRLLIEIVIIRSVPEESGRCGAGPPNFWESNREIYGKNGLRHMGEMGPFSKYREGCPHERVHRVRWTPH